MLGLKVVMVLAYGCFPEVVNSTHDRAFVVLVCFQKHRAKIG